MPDPFVQQLIDLCSKWPTRAKWVIVPSYSIGHTLGERLVISGTDWANLRFVTPLDLAVRMAGPFLVERSIAPSEDTLGPALMVRLLLELPDETGYFKPLADQPSIGAHLWKTIRELRMAGISSSDLSSKPFGSAAKKTELVRLLAAYENYLKDSGVADMPALFEEAARHLDYSPIQPGHCWTELPDTSWPVLVQELIDLLGGERIEPAFPLIRGVSRPRRFRQARSENSAATAVAIKRDVDRMSFLLNPENAPSPLDDDSLEIFHAGGRDAEIEEVFRRILSSGLSVDQIEIACASADQAILAWEKANLHSLPATSEYGHAAAATRPGRALLAWCEWVERDFDAASLRRLLQSGDLNPKAFSTPDLTESFSPGQAARLLLRAQASWGPDTYKLSIGRLVNQLESRALDPELSEEERKSYEQRALRAKSLLDWIEELIKAVPLPGDDGQVSVREMAQTAVSFLEANSARTSALDGTALVRLRESLGELKSFGDYRAGRAVSLRFVRERIADLSVGAERTRPGHLFLSRLAHAGLSGRQILFVVGLEEGRVFSSTIEDPVLLDHERAQISSRLRTSKDRLDENVYAVVSRLASLDAKRVCLSFSCHDNRQFRETFPSWILLEAWRIKTGKPSASFDDLKKALSEPASRVPAMADAALSDAGWWLNRAKLGGDRIIPELLNSFPSLARGLDASEMRDSSEFTEFDGFVPAAGPDLDPSTSGRSVSATTLEGAAACPFRYFLERGLGVQPLQENEKQADIWLDPLTRGSELHAIYASIMREVRNNGKWPPPERFVKRIAEMTKTRLSQLKAELPPPSEDVFARESEEFMDDVELFMQGQCRLKGVEGIGFEVGFGSGKYFSSDDRVEPLSNVEPLAIDLGSGRQIRLRGRIDRINRLSDGSYEIVDYKTGGFWRDNWKKGTFLHGTRLQHALYSLAAQWLIGAREKAKVRIKHAVYLFPTRKGWDSSVSIAQDDGRGVRNVLNDLCDTIAGGTFIHTPKDGDCKWCDYAAACGPARFESSSTKFDEPRIVVLKSFRKLRSHE